MSSPPPPGPYSISQYGSGARVRHSTFVVYILLLCTATFFTLYSKWQHELLNASVEIEYDYIV